VISVGWNCAEFLDRCIQSVVSQVGVDWNWYAVLDGGKENEATRQEMHAMRTRYGGLMLGRHEIWHAVGRRYAMCNLAEALGKVGELADPNDRVALVDLDDALANDRALATAEKFHEAGAWVTYGSYVTTSGRPPKFHGAYKAGENLRAAKWKATHLRTFRYGLWKHIRPRDLRGADGCWFKAAYDLAMFFPMMELAGPERVRHIPDTLYLYNDTSPHNDHKVQWEEQKRCERYIRRLPPYKQVEVL